MNNFWFFDNNTHIAYLLGIYLTDGNIVSSDGRSLRFEVLTKDKEIPDRVADAAYVFFGKRPSVRIKMKKYKDEARPYWHVYVNSTSMAKWLQHVTDNKATMPSFVFDQDRQWKLELLAGLLDGDGWATFSSNRYETKSGKPPTWYCQVGLISVLDKSYASKIPALLDSLDVRYKINYSPARKQGYQDQQRILINPSDFITNGLYFRVARKQEKVLSFKSYTTFND